MNLVSVRCVNGRLGGERYSVSAVSIERVSLIKISFKSSAVALVSKIPRVWEASAIAANIELLTKRSSGDWRGTRTVRSTEVVGTVGGGTSVCSSCCGGAVEV